MKTAKYWLDDNLENDFLKEYEILKKITKHNIIKERVELYNDFAINLLYYIYETYLGREYIKTDYDVRGHFNWAYLKVLDEFEEEGISFFDNDDLYQYFFKYYYNYFYEQDKIYKLSYYEKFWNDIFTIRKSNNKREVFEVLIQLYKIFDKSLTEKNEKILEKI